MPATFLGDGNQYKLIYFIYFWYAIILYVTQQRMIVSISRSLLCLAECCSDAEAPPEILYKFSVQLHNVMPHA